MVGKTHGQSQMAKQNQQLTALQEINDRIAQLRKRNKARVQRPQQGERRFGDAPEAVYVEPKPPDPSRINQHPTSQTHTHHVANSRFDHKSFADKIELFTFSGGRSYLFWERNLDEWFHYNNILKEERLSYAIDQLRGNAFKWWVQEEDDRWFYKEPAIKTWRDLKEVMRDEFSPELTSSKIRKIYPRRYLTHVSKENPEPVIVQVKAKDDKTGPEVKKETISKSLLDLKVVHDLSPRNDEISNPKKEEASSQGKSSKFKDLKDQTCSRCHKRGHFAVVCPTKKALTETSLEEKTELSMKSDSFIQSDLLVPNSCVMHLSLSKGDVTGTKEHEFKGEEPPGATPVMDQKMVQDTMQSMLLKEAKPVIKVSHQGKFQTPPLDTSTDVCVLGTGRTNESYKLIVVPKKEPDPKLSHGPLLSGNRNQSEQSIVQVLKPMVRFLLDKHVLNISMTDIMHLLFVQNVENFSGCKEESFKEIPPDYHMLLGGSTPKMIRNVATKNLKDHPLQKIRNDHVQSRGVIHAYFLKGEPPDTNSIPKPKQFQGKVLESQKRMKADLLYLGAGYIVSRSKPCQEGGDVVVTKPMVQPESHQTVQTGHLEGTSDRGSVQGVYLHNQKDFQHETNFIGFYTQEVVQPNWNRAKVFTEQEVMNFTSQTFPSPSICEYPILEGDSSPRKERPEPKPIIGFKRSLSAFQKAQDQEKWQRNYEVMIQSPKPVKPVLHLPQLEANRFNQLQTRHWRPGDISMHSGSLSNGLEESEKFIPCTSPHRIRRILINPNLPYLELLAIQLQQLFFLQIRHDLSTLQTIKKVPRKLSYPLKPSRYKENTIYIHLAKILIIKLPTASFHGAINSFASKFIISTLLVSLCHFMTVRESQ
ncbi:uncharacterized protein LOC117130981 [Brassica rapa]|uniref:uncharacterized protein LOC117130981 n=1 Tax=Brassica campestris TaxID=3711 RepID=UPI00142D5DEB|nr:uncharacterized protein LOC117130981 [Brassica rapa]